MQLRAGMARAELVWLARIHQTWNSALLASVVYAWQLGQAFEREVYMGKDSNVLSISCRVVPYLRAPSIFANRVPTSASSSELVDLVFHAANVIVDLIVSRLAELGKIAPALLDHHTEL